MNKQSLQELRDKVDGNKIGPIWYCKPETGFVGEIPRLIYKASYKNSLDAAVAFLKAVLPEWSWGVQRTYEGSFLASVGQFTAPNMVRNRFETHADTPARALLLATLDALIERAE